MFLQIATMSINNTKEEKTQELLRLLLHQLTKMKVYCVFVSCNVGLLYWFNFHSTVTQHSHSPHIPYSIF